jgi:hypothetical protein
VLLKAVAFKMNDHTEENDILPESQSGFRRDRSTIDLIYVMRMLCEFSFEKCSDLFLCFVDIKKAYDNVNRELLWKILARYGFPSGIIGIIKAFYDGMKASIHFEDGSHSVYFSIDKGLRQGCVLSCILFNIYLGAAIEVALNRIESSEWKDLIYAGAFELKYGSGNPLDAKSRQETKKKDEEINVLRKIIVWCLLYADDSVMPFRTRKAMKYFMIILKRAFMNFGLPISEEKTEVMHIPGRNRPKIEFSLSVDEHTYKQTEVFKYLGILCSSDLSITEELKARTKGAWKKFYRYSEVIFDCDHIKTNFKVMLFKMEVMEVLLHACMTWTTRKEDFDTLQQLHAAFLKRLIGYRPVEGVLKTRAYWRCLIDTECEPIEVTIRYRRLMWASKLVNLKDDRLTKQTLFGELNFGRRRVGRNKQWRSCVKSDVIFFGLNKDTWMLDASKEDWNERVNNQKAKAIESFFEKSKQKSKINHQKEDLKKTISDLDEVLHVSYHKIKKVDTSPLDKILHPSFNYFSTKKRRQNTTDIYRYIYKLFI